MNEDQINRIPPHLRPFLQVDCGILPADDPVFDALIEAIKVIDGKIRIDKIYRIFLGRSPFQIPASAGSFTYNMEPTTAGIVIENLIFIDYAMLIPYPSALKVAIILEEFVHALLNVVDHLLTRQIVSSLYPSIVCDIAGQFHLRSPQNAGGRPCD